MAPPAKRQKVSTSIASSASRDRLYDTCLRNGGTNKTWTIDMLKSLGVARGEHELMSRCQELINAELFQPVEASGGHAAAFKLRSRSAAHKFSLLTDGDAAEVYRHIENAGVQGMWKLTLKKRTGIHENKIEKLLKSLCSSKHIKQLKGVRSGAKKTFMLYDLQPAKEVTGGAWYSDGDLDVDFIDIVANLVIHYVKDKSWISGPKLPSNRQAAHHETRSFGPRLEQHENGAIHLGSDDAEAELRMLVATDSKNRVLLPYPPDYDDYPTASEVLDKIITSGLVKDKSITLGDMQELFTRLVYDGRIERIGTKGHRRKFDSDSEHSDDVDGDDADKNAVVDEEHAMYRWVKRPDAWKPHDARDEDEVDFAARSWNAVFGPGNGYSEVPCSRCPVFALCEEGGPVEAKSCSYFEEWF